MTTSDDDLTRLTALVKDAKIALLTTVNADGHLHSRPLGLQQEDFDGDLWFLTQDPSSKVDDIRANPQVNVAFESSKGWVSIAGTATIVHDEAKTDELWTPQASAWFPEGREDPTIALVHVQGISAEIWSTDDPKVVVLFKLTKAALTGGQPDIGENKAFEL
jgi:general stress protein 26